MRLPAYDDIENLAAETRAFIAAGGRRQDGRPPEGDAGAEALEADAMRRALALRQSFRWANGVVLIPTFVTLARRGAFAGLEAGGTVGLTALAARADIGSRRTYGVLWGALRLLTLQGWLRLDGSDAHSRYALTPVGQACARIYEARRDLFDTVPAWVEMFSDLPALLSGAAGPAAYARFERLAARQAERWGLASAGPEDAPALQAREELAEALDGLLIGPLLTAFDMPEFRRTEHGFEKVGPSVFEHWRGGNGQFPDPIDDRLRGPATALLARQGLAVASPLRLTPWGDLLRSIAAPFAGLGASYLRSYARLDDILFSHPDPLGVSEDRHVDRLVNIYASSGAGSGPLSRTFLENVIGPLFAQPLARQPAGVADMGCGDGSALLRMARFIVEETPRGRALSDHPLVVVGADYNASARSVAAANLRALASIEGVITRVVAADISDPATYDRTLRACGLEIRGPDGARRAVGLADLVHSFMFLLHNRRLSVRDDAEAEQIFRTHIKDEETLRMARQGFRVSYAGPAGMVSGFTAAADLLALLDRWRPYAGHGFAVVEAHSPSADVDDDGGASPACPPGDLPHVLNWGMHFLSQQYMTPYKEFRRIMAFAGYAPTNGAHGRLYPAHISGIDAEPNTRFFNVAHYVPIREPQGAAE